MQTRSLNPPVMEGREAPEQTFLPSWACWWRPWQWVCQAGQKAQQRWTRRWVQGPARRQKSGRKPAEPAGSAALGPGAACCIGQLVLKGFIRYWYFIKVLASFSSAAASGTNDNLHFCFICWLFSPSINYKKNSVYVHSPMFQPPLPFQRRKHNPLSQSYLVELTKIESTMVMSKLQNAMEMKPVRRSLLLPAFSIKKNLKHKQVTAHIFPVLNKKANFVLWFCDNKVFVYCWSQIYDVWHNLQFVSDIYWEEQPIQWHH